MTFVLSDDGGDQDLEDEHAHGGVGGMDAFGQSFLRMSPAPPDGGGLGFSNPTDGGGFSDFFGSG